MSRTSGLALTKLLPYLFCYTDRDATEHLLRCCLPLHCSYVGLVCLQPHSAQQLVCQAMSSSWTATLQPPSKWQAASEL